jgi:hypothetical protein
MDVPPFPARQCPPPDRTGRGRRFPPRTILKMIDAAVAEAQEDRDELQHHHDRGVIDLTTAISKRMRTRKRCRPNSRSTSEAGNDQG